VKTVYLLTSVLVSQALPMVIKFFEDGTSNGDHHRGTGRVTKPHRQETRHHHEPKQDPIAYTDHTYTHSVEWYSSSQQTHLEVTEHHLPYGITCCLTQVNAPTTTV